MIPDSNFKPTPPQKNPRKQNAIIKLRTYIHITTLFKMPKEDKMKFKKKNMMTVSHQIKDSVEK